MNTHGGTPRMPRSILVVSDQDYRALSQDPDDVERLEDREALVVPFSTDPEVNEEEVRLVRELLEDSGQLATGALLVRNPYDSANYVSAAEAIESFALAKYHHLAVVASLLGARAVRVTDAKVERHTSDVRVTAKVGAKGASGEADSSTAYAEEIAAHLKLETDFSGSDPNPTEALAYVQEHNLATEHAITALVHLRRGANPVIRYQLTLDATRESQRNVTSAVKLATALPKLAEGGLDFTRNASHVGSIKITTEITFPSSLTDDTSPMHVDR